MTFWRTYVCDVCGAETEDCYRCTECRTDLADTETTVAGRDSVPFRAGGDEQ